MPILAGCLQHIKPDSGDAINWTSSYLVLAGGEAVLGRSAGPDCSAKPKTSRKLLALWLVWPASRAHLCSGLRAAARRVAALQ